MPNQNNIEKQTPIVSKIVAGRYLVERELGKGGMGRVFVVKDMHRDGESLALKLLSDAVKHERVAEQFVNEFRLLKRLDRSELVKVFDYGVSKQFGAFFTMEYVTWKSLNEQPKDLSSDHLIRVLYDLARALSILHSSQIAHYDLKPNNIFIDWDRLDTDAPSAESIVKLADLGMAGSVVRDSASERWGSYLFSAPEMFGHDRIDLRADIYSYGMIALYMILGDEAFNSRMASSRESTSIGLLHSISDFNPGYVPASVASTLFKCTNPESGFRPSNIDHIIEVLSPHVEDKLRQRNPKLASEFIGRTGSLRFLGSVFHNVCLGEQWVFAINGEESSGKSRLIEEFAFQKQIDGFEVIRLEGSNLEPLLISLSESQIKLDNSSTLIDTSITPSDVQLMSLLESRNSTAPVVVTWDRFDQASKEIKNLMKIICLKYPDTAILWLLETREDIAAFVDLGYSDRFVRRNVKPLLQAEVETFIGRVLDKPLGWKLLSEQVFALSQGKPGLVIYILNRLIDSQQIVFSNQKWYIIAEDLDLKKSSIDTVIQGSLKKASRAAKWALEWLSVLCKSIEVNDLKNVLEFSDEEWIGIYRELNSAGFVHVTSGFLSFKQEILREVVYRSIPTDSRRRLHHLVGRWLEDDMKVANDFSSLQIIAHHYQIAAENRSFLRVIKLLLDISGSARNLQLIPELYEDTLKNFRHHLKEAHQYRCIELLANHNMRLKQFEVAADLFKHLIDARAFKNLEYPGFLELRLGLCYSYLSEYDKGEKVLSRAYANLIKFDPSAAGDALALLVKLHYHRNSLKRSNRLLDSYLRLIDSLEEPDHRLSHQLKCSILLKNNHRHEEAAQLLESIRMEYPNPWQSKKIFSVYLTDFQLAFYQGDKVRTKELLAKLDHNIPLDNPVKNELWKVRFYQGMAQLMAGNLQKGLGQVENLIQKLRMHADPRKQASLMINLVRIYYHCGNYWKGMQYIKRGIRLVNKTETTHIKAVYILWAARFMHQMGKDPNRLIAYALKLAKIADRPSSNFWISVLLIEHYWVANEEKSIEPDFMDLQNNIVGSTQAEYPKPLLELLKMTSVSIMLNSDEILSKIEAIETEQIDINDMIARAQCNHILMVLKIKLENRSQAHRHFRHAIKLYRKSESIYMIAKCQEDYGKACLRWGDVEEGKLHLDQAWQTYIGLNLQVPECLTSAMISDETKLIRKDSMLNVNRLKDLSDILEMLNGMESPDKITSKLLDIALQSVDAKRGMIFFKNARSGKLSKRASMRIGIKEGVDISRTIVDQVFRSGEAIYHNDALVDNYLSTLDSIRLNKIRAVACMPIVSKGEIEGVLYLDNSGSVKPFSEIDKSYLGILSNVIGLILSHTRLIEELSIDIKTMQSKVDRTEGYDEFKGNAKPVKEIYRILHYLKESDTSVLILGESGTGKELIARIINRESSRSSKPFYAISCAALPDQLLDSMLFGHCKGAFTDAKSDHAGFFEQASGGTIFLDEVDKMSFAMQSKLLRVLQEGEYYRLGETKIRKTDIRVIAAGKNNLPQMAEEGAFRQDLYFRLYVVRLILPPLRERVEDIPLLIKHFLQKYGTFDGRVIAISTAAESALIKYRWLGNVRQLENTIRGAIIFAHERGIIEFDHLPEEIREEFNSSGRDIQNHREHMEQTEEKHILFALEVSHWNISETAKRLQIHRSTVIKKMQKYKISRPDTSIGEN
ncbi:sigma 54-interacting transcriptional regulator [Calditrichota bacterium]